MLGSRLTTIAYPLLILAWHGSPVVAGLAVCAANAPSVLVYIPAGVLVDRWPDPRRTLIVAEILRGAAIAAIICVLVLNWRCIPLVILIAIFEESFEVFALLAERRYVQALVEPDQASAAQVGMEARTHVVVLAGRALGGLLFGWAQALPFIADLVSFGVSVLSVTGIKRGERQTASSARAAWLNFRRLLGLWADGPDLRSLWKEIEDLWEEMRTGGNALFKDAFAFHASLFSAGMTLVSQALIIVFLASAHDKHVSSVVIGSVLAASGVGGLLGAMASQRSARPWNKSPLKFQPLIWTVMLFILAALGWLMVPVMAVVMAVLGLAGAMGNVELDTYLLVKVPRGKLARVTSIEMLLDFLAGSLGPALGGLLIESGGTEFSIWVLLTLSALIAIPALRMSVPDVRLPTGWLLPGLKATVVEWAKLEWRMIFRYDELFRCVAVQISLVAFWSNKAGHKVGWVKIRMTQWLSHEFMRASTESWPRPVGVGQRITMSPGDACSALGALPVVVSAGFDKATRVVATNQSESQTSTLWSEMILQYPGIDSESELLQLQSLFTMAFYSSNKSWRRRAVSGVYRQAWSGRDDGMASASTSRPDSAWTSSTSNGIRSGPIPMSTAAALDGHPAGAAAVTEVWFSRDEYDEPIMCVPDSRRAANCRRRRSR